MKVLFFIKCVIIGLSNCEFIEHINEHDHFPPKITLLSSDHEHHTIMNDEFRWLAIKLGFEIQEEWMKENSIAATVEIITVFPNVINLRVPGKNDIKERMKEKEALYTSDNIRCLKRYHNEIIPECDFSNDSIIYSEGILKYKSLLKLIETGRNASPKILVCRPRSFNIEVYESELTHKHQDMSLIFEDCDQNTEVAKDYLAVLADMPIQDTEVPTIFYQTPYKYSWLKDHFPNSINVSAPWRPLKYALISFLKHMKWSRVAVVSDDSEYSEAFLGELLPLFVKEGIVFNNQDCKGRECDFNEALDTLNKAKARIVIFNVDPGKYGDLLSSAINRFQKTPMKWIVRDWPFQNQAPHANIYSLTLYPTYKKDGSRQFPYFSAIKEGLKIIKDVYRSVLGDGEIFKRDFTKLAKRRRYDISARLSYHRLGKAAIKVADYTIVGSQAKAYKYYLPEAISSDLPQNCIVRSNDFSSPCAHDVILLLFSICIMFVFIMLIIVVYFNAVRSHDYRRFS